MDVFLRFISGHGSVPWKRALAGSETPLYLLEMT